MIARNYLLIFDRPHYFDPQKLHSFISKESGISDWWHFLESAYILVSLEDILALQNKFVKHFNGISFLILPVSLASTAGMLPKDAWDWINTRKKLPV